jgi:glycosyltransferase involved in cell wall biosynthesis
VRLLVLCQDPEGPVVRHRVRAILPQLDAAGFDDIRIEGIPSGVLARHRLLLSGGDAALVLVMRKLFSQIDLKRLRAAAPRVAFDLDDAVMVRDPFQRAAPSRTRRKRFAATVHSADLVMAGNVFLSEQVEVVGRGRVPVTFAPTPIDCVRFVPGLRPSGTQRVGWIGSRSTRPYLAGIAAPLGRLLAARPDLRFAVMADAPPDLPFDVEFSPWSEAAEVPFLQSLSVGVMPLTDDEWSRGKCGFKLLQYMACAVPSVASPVGANVEIADYGTVARLPTGDAAWESELGTLLDDRTAAAELGALGRARMESHYAADVLGPRYADALARCARGESA